MSATPNMDTSQAAAFLGVSPRWLEQLRFRGGGPVYYKLGRRCLYKQADLENWFAERAKLHTSTSQVEAA